MELYYLGQGRIVMVMVMSVYVHTAYFAVKSMALKFHPTPPQKKKQNDFSFPSLVCFSPTQVIFFTLAFASFFFAYCTT